MAVTVSVAEAVLCFSARVCKQQRELERVCNGQPKKKPNTAVIGPARSLGTGIANVRDQQLLKSGIMHADILQLLRQGWQCIKRLSLLSKTSVK